MFENHIFTCNTYTLIDNMSKTNANFQVDPKLAELLGETYKSTEDAIKELVDNAYDADADSIYIKMPELFTENAVITISDDGTGMKEQEVRNEYLKIASSRFSRKGDKTYLKNRQVKGRKGIGKFSGLMIAEAMKIDTKAGGKHTELSILKDQLAREKYDLEKVALPLQVSDCDTNAHGTTITLSGLNQNFNYPNPDKLKQILVWEYGRVENLAIYVNDEKIGISDFQGKNVDKEIKLSNGSIAHLVYTICDKTTRQSGIVYRVGGKVVGRPENFLKDNEAIPEKLKKRIIGELICDDLEDFVTADWGAIVENSILNQQLIDEVKKELTLSLNEVFKTDMHLARMRYKQKLDRELQKLPEYKRDFAEKALLKVIEKFYGEPEDKVNSIISVMVDALEKDYYWNVINNIGAARDGEIESLAEAFNEFGILEMSIITSQAINRLRFLDELDDLINRPNILEATLHKSLESNLWIFGNEHSLISSNKTLGRMIADYLDQKYKGAEGTKRPDLFLGTSIFRKYLLIEFKKASVTIDRDAESQAMKYRDELNIYLRNQQIDIMVIGGSVKANIASHNERSDVKLLSYKEIISNARTQLSWMLDELKHQKA